MDPYLERHWGGLHHRLIVYAADALQTQLPANFHARIEERVYIEMPNGHARDFVPDVFVVQRAKSRRPRARTGGRVGNGKVAVAEPMVIDVGELEVTETYIEIRDAKQDERVITAIDFVSPKNKVTGPGRDSYLEKQRSFLASDTSLVEIDLVRTGKHVVAVPLTHIPPADRSCGIICIRRPTWRQKANVIPMPLRNRLPLIRIPLRPGDREPLLDLQLLIDRAYRKGEYDEEINYTREPDPPLSAADARWADALLRKKGLR
jgi:hypothetical protein